MVEKLCKTVEIESLLEEVPLPLSQPVLLSMIQQLSEDLKNGIDWKYQIIYSALPLMDPNDRLTKVHVETLLKRVETRLAENYKTMPRLPHELQVLMK